MKPELPEDVIHSFHLMWDNFPETVMLSHKSHQIMAVNKAGRLFGLAPGIFCNKVGSPESHKGCLAHKALATGKTQTMSIHLEGRDAVTFWLPIEGFPDFYIHFAVGFTMNYKAADQ